MYTGKVSSLISQDYFWNAYMAEKFNESYCCHTLCKTTFQSKCFGVTCCITHKGENESFLCFSKGNPRTCISIDVLWNSVDVIGVLSIGVFTFVLFSTIWRLMMNNYYLLHEIFLASRKSAKCFSLGFFFCAEVPRKWLIMCKFDNRLMEICWKNNLVSMPLFICGCPFSQQGCQRPSACSFRVVAFPGMILILDHFFET